MSSIRFDTAASAPAQPPTGDLALYAKNDDKLYIKNDAGVETVLALAGVVGASNVLYVETDGNDGTGTKGDPALPYATLSGAIADAVSGDVLRIGVGTFSANGFVAAMPANLDIFTVIGSGCDIKRAGGTVITNTANDGTHIFVPPNTADYWSITDLYAEVTLGGGQALRADGSGGAANAFLGGQVLTMGTGGLVLRNAVLRGATTSMYLNHVGLCDMTNVVTSGIGTTPMTHILSSNIFPRAVGCVFGNLTIGWDWTDTLDIPTVRVTSTFMACKAQNLTLSGSLNVSFASDCEVENITGLNLATHASGGPEVVFRGRCRVVDFFTAASNEWPNTGANSTEADFDRAHIVDEFKWKTATTVLQVSARGAILPSGTNDVEAGEKIHLNCLGAIYPMDGTNFQTSGDGKISVHQLCITFTTEVDGSTPVTFPFVMNATPVYVVATPAALAVGPLAISAKSGTGVTLESSASVGTVDLVLYWTS